MPGTGTEPTPDPDKMLNKLRNQEQVQEQFRFQHQDLSTLNEQIPFRLLIPRHQGRSGERLLAKVLKHFVKLLSVKDPR